MCLRFVFLPITRASQLLAALGHKVWKTAEILMPPSACRPAATADAPPEAELGGSGSACNPAQRDTESAPPGAEAAGYPGHDRALAPRHRPPPLGRPVRVRQDRPAGDPPQHPGTAHPGTARRRPHHRRLLTPAPGRDPYARCCHPQSGQPLRTDPAGDSAGNPAQGLSQPPHQRKSRRRLATLHFGTASGVRAQTLRRRTRNHRRASRRSDGRPAGIPSPLRRDWRP
jgi:hypothetical protein